MISKRTAIILIIAIIAIVIFEVNFGFEKMEDMQNNADHTTAQITLNIDGKLTDLEGIPVEYSNEGTEKTFTSKLGKISESGYENQPNNPVAFKLCATGKNKLSFTIPENMIPNSKTDLTVNFGCENNSAEFNSYALTVNITTTEEGPKAEIKQTLYYPDEKGNPLNKKATASQEISIENKSIDCFVK